MVRGKRDGLLIAGGGLAGSLAALAMARLRPEVPILLVEEGEQFGGEHVLPCFDRDLGPDDRRLAEPLLSRRWPGYYTIFPGRTRKLRAPGGAITPDAIEQAVREVLRPDQYRLGTRIVAVRDNELILQGGEKIRADGAIDARGPANLSLLDMGWENRIGRAVRLTGPHGLDRPVTIDATASAAEAARFTRTFPLGEDLLWIEDVGLSELPGTDESEGEARIGAYAERRGWTVTGFDGGDAAARPLPIGGDFAGYWRVGGARAAKLGPRGGFFHPASGGTLADALRTAILLTRQRDFTGTALHDLYEAEAAQTWRRREPYRAFNKRLFAAPPAGRMALLGRVYGLDAAFLARFHADRMTMMDRMRLARLA